LAKRHGVNRTAHVLRLEYGGLRKRVESQARPQAKSKRKEAASFLEFIAPGAKPVSNCTVEVESAHGGIDALPQIDRFQRKHPDWGVRICALCTCQILLGR
jgi:hypothetical protein